jgi:hypothetical protein
VPETLLQEKINQIGSDVNGLFTLTLKKSHVLRIGSGESMIPSHPLRSAQRAAADGGCSTSHGPALPIGEDENEPAPALEH